MSISTGYRKGKRAENANKVEVWVIPKFGVEREIGAAARYLAGIMGSFSAPVGLFWTWGGWDNPGVYDYLTTDSLDIISSRDMYENYKKSIHTISVDRHWRALHTVDDEDACRSGCLRRIFLQF